MTGGIKAVHSSSKKVFFSESANPCILVNSRCHEESLKRGISGNMKTRILAVHVSLLNQLQQNSILGTGYDIDEFCNQLFGT